jgi:uncharacterized membrane protein
LRRLVRLLAAIILVVLPALPALAKSYEIADADVVIEVEPDGSLLVTEHLTYDFSGSFSGAYRDVRLRPGETFQFVSIGDETTTFAPGGCAFLGCTSPAGTFGIDEQPGIARVVWHHSSNDELRTFELVYRLSGLTRVYDDVVDLNFQVWGDQWSVPADHVTAEALLPTGGAPGDVRVFGHPYGVDGETSCVDTASSSSSPWVSCLPVSPRRHPARRPTAACSTNDTASHVME